MPMRHIDFQFQTGTKCGPKSILLVILSAAVNPIFLEVISRLFPGQ